MISLSKEDLCFFITKRSHVEANGKYGGAKSLGQDINIHIYIYTKTKRCNTYMCMHARSLQGGDSDKPMSFCYMDVGTLSLF